jgi:hypothetical protein
VNRRLYTWFLLAVFFTATTGFTISQCCCDKNPKHSCCRDAKSNGCKTDVTYLKLKTDFDAATKVKVDFTRILFGLFPFAFDGYQVVSQTIATGFTDSGPPLLSLNSLSRLQVFRI